MDPRSQRMLLVVLVMVLTILLYKDFSESGTVRRLTQHAASFAGRKVNEASQHTAFEPANATLGVSVFRIQPCVR
jgi:hypothetical protein